MYKFVEEKDRSKKNLMINTMGSIFFVFGILKLLDLTKFVEIFSKYDIITKYIKLYGFIYPFLEIYLASNLFYKKHLRKTYIGTIILMILSIIGVSISMISGQKLRCGCLGSFLHIPLSYVTISENIVMLLMSGYLTLK